jgi:phosphoserine phosphatase
MKNPQGRGVLYDCDGTLIGKIYGALIQIVSDRALTALAKEELVEIRSRYMALDVSGSITVEQYRHWLLEELSLYVRHALKTDDWRSALSHVRLRPGAFELISDLHQAGVRQGIVSAAIADFVEYVLEINGVRHMIDVVYAARLVYDENGVVIGHEEATIVHPGNKGDCSLDFALRFGLNPDELIGLGDSGGDAKLGSLTEHRIGVAESEDRAVHLRSLGIMGEVVIIVDLHFQPVSDAIKRRLGLT